MAWKEGGRMVVLTSQLLSIEFHVETEGWRRGGWEAQLEQHLAGWLAGWLAGSRQRARESQALPRCREARSCR